MPDELIGSFVFNMHIEYIMKQLVFQVDDTTICNMHIANIGPKAIAEKPCYHRHNLNWNLTLSTLSKRVLI